MIEQDIIEEMHIPKFECHLRLKNFQKEIVVRVNHFPKRKGNQYFYELSHYLSKPHEKTREIPKQAGAHDEESALDQALQYLVDLYSSHIESGHTIDDEWLVANADWR